MLNSLVLDEVKRFFACQISRKKIFRVIVRWSQFFDFEPIFTNIQIPYWHYSKIRNFRFMTKLSKFEKFGFFDLQILKFKKHFDFWFWIWKLTDFCQKSKKDRMGISF